MNNPILCFSCMTPLSSREETCPHCGYNNRIRQNGVSMLGEVVLNGQYLVGRYLGRGGFGITYIGYDLLLQRRVAIKEYFPSHIVGRDEDKTSLIALTGSEEAFQKGRERALREGRMAASLGHIPGIVQIYNTFVDNNTVYIVMEYIHGNTLTEYVANQPGRLSLSDAMTLLSPIASALQTLHDQKVIHRDVKPDNIMIRQLRKEGVLLDFGAARALDEKTLSNSSAVVSPGYAPPEQYNSSSLDGRIDQYAFAATLFYTLTGQRPPDVMMRIAQGNTMPSIRAANPGVPAAAEHAIMKGMSIMAENRYSSVDALWKVLEKAAGMNKKKSEKPIQQTKEKTGKAFPKIAAIGLSAVVAGGSLAYFLLRKDVPVGTNHAMPAVVEVTEGQTAPETELPAPQATSTPVPKTTAAPTAEPTQAPTAVPVAALPDILAKDFEYEELPGGGYIITKYIGTDTKVVIPEGVTAIGDEAFMSLNELTEITLPQSLTSIGIYAFSNCAQLKNVAIPANVTFIGKSAFSNCSALTGITIPDGISSIEAYTFSNCSALTSITLPKEMTSIGNSAFKNCSSLLAIDIPSGLTSISNSTFWGCSALTAVTVPEGVTSIGGDSFRACSALQEITLPESVTSIEAYAFNSCHALPEIHLPEGLVFIGEGAFSNCTSLRSIAIPGGIHELLLNTFLNCNRLTEVSLPNGLTTIGNSVFEGCAALAHITIPEGVTLLGKTPFVRCTNLRTVVLPSSIKKFSDEEDTYDGKLFDDCRQLKAVIVNYGSKAHRYCKENNLPVLVFDEDYQYEFLPSGVEITGYSGKSSTLTIPEGVTSIGDYAFADRSDITTVNIPEGVISIGSHAFSNCFNLSKVSMPDSVTFIGDYAFSRCFRLSLISIPAGVTSIGNSAFSNCSKLKNITIPSNVTSIGDHAFSHCTSLTSLILPDSVTSIGDSAFFNCRSLKKITLSANLTAISSNAFRSCSSLTGIEFPGSITSIGDFAFADCSKLKRLSIPESVTAIGVYAFQNCSMLSEITVCSGSVAEEYCQKNNLPYILLEEYTSQDNNFQYTIRNNECTIDKYIGNKTEVGIPKTIDGYPVTIIGERAFFNHSQLVTLRLPQGITTIEELAFYNCGITQIVIPDSVTHIGKSAFLNCMELKSVVLPAGLTTIESETFMGCVKIRKVIIPEGVTRIEENAFKHNTALQSVQFPSTLEYVANGAFAPCINLEKVTLPAKTVVELGAFHDLDLTYGSYTPPIVERWD